MRRSYGLAPALSGPHQEAPAPLVERMRDDRFWQAALQQAGPIAAGDPHQDPSLLSVTTGSLGPSGHNGAGGAAPQGRWDRRPPHRTRNVGFVPASPSAPHGPGAQPHPPKIPISVRRAQAPGERSGRRLWRPASGERTGQDTAPRQAAQGRPDADVPVGRAERRADARFVRLPTRLDLGASGSSDDGEDPESWLDEASPRATHSPRVNDDEGVTGGFAMGPERPASAQSDATSLLSGLSEDEDEEDGGERMAPWEVSGKANGAGDGEGAAPVSTQAGASEQDETPRERERSDYFRSCREVGARWLKEGAPAGRRKQGAGAPAGSVAIKDGGSRVREAYITACAKRRLVPEPLGMLSSTRRRATMAGGGGGGSGTCNLNSFAIGDARCSALAQRLASEGSLSPMDPERITGLGLADNRLTHVGASALCEALAVNPAITQLDLSRNRIGLEGVDALCTVLRMKTCRIETLALAGNQAGDRGTASICAAVAGSSSVTDLDLSHNSVGPKAAEALADMITTTRSLRRLNCAWNNIRAGAAGKVASALRLNDTIGDLDLGFNAVGSSRDNWATQVLGETLAVNVTLLHLNLSHNGIDDRGARFLAQGLASNKALMAIHFTGNPAVVRLMRCEREQPGADATQVRRSACVPRPCGACLTPFPAQAESGIYARFLCFPKVHDHDVWKERQACWICQCVAAACAACVASLTRSPRRARCRRWDVHTFRYRSPEDGPAPQSSVRVALSFTGWKETEMELSRHSPRGPLEAHLSLMVRGPWPALTVHASCEAPLHSTHTLQVPPSRFQYTFRVDGKEMVSKSQPTEPTTRPADDKLTQTLCDKFQLDQADARLLMRQLKAAGFVRIPLMGGPISVASPSEAPQGAGTGNGHVAGHAVDDDVLATWARTMEARDVASVLAVLRSCEEPEVLDEAHGARVEARHAIRPPRLDSHALMRSRVPKVAQWNAQTSLFRHFPRDTRDRLRAAFERDWKCVGCSSLRPASSPLPPRAGWSSCPGPWRRDSTSGCATCCTSITRASRTYSGIIARRARPRTRSAWASTRSRR